MSDGSVDPYKTNTTNERKRKTSSSECTYFTTSSDTETKLIWIKSIKKSKKHRLLVSVDEEYIMENFNLTGLSEYVSNYHACLENIQKSDVVKHPNELILYYLIHQRFLMTETGMNKIMWKIKNETYGKCPQYGCESAMMPYGKSVKPGVSQTFLYCYNCGSMYKTNKSLSSIDGAAFGPTYQGMLVLSHPEIFEKHTVPCEKLKIFGFDIERDPKFFNNRP